MNINFNTDTVVGTIPIANVPLGTGAGQVAAGNDSRLTKAVRSVACMADLRALPAPVAGVDSLEVATHTYYLNESGGGNSFRWSADSTDDDNGGTVICPDAPTKEQSGRWLAVNYGTSIADVSQFGAHPSQTNNDVNRKAIQAAHDTLLNVSADAAAHVLPRQGLVTIPPGTYSISGPLYFYAGGVHVRGSGRLATQLVLAANTYDADHPVYFIDFERSANELSNNDFASGLFGLAVLCGDNAGASGVRLQGAQGTLLDDVLVGNFGGTGVKFTGEEIGTLWVTGNSTATGPGLILEGMQGGHVRNADVEHLRYANLLVAGQPVPYVLIQSCNGVVLESVVGESSAPEDPSTHVINGIGETFLQINDSHNVSIGLIVTNQIKDTPQGDKANALLITGNSGNCHCDMVANVGGSSNLVNDVSATGGGPAQNYQLHGAGYTTYHQMFYAAGLGAGSVSTRLLDADTITSHGIESPKQVFLQTLTQGRFRLRFTVGYNDNYIINSPQYLCRFQHSDGKKVTFLFSLDHPGSAASIPQVTVLEGDGLLVTFTETPGTTREPQVDFSVVQPDASFGGYCRISVTQLGTFEPQAVNPPFTWTAIAETQSDVKDGTALNTLPAPVDKAETIKAKVTNSSRASHASPDPDSDLSVAIGVGTYEFEADAWVAAASSDQYYNLVRFGVFGWTGSGDFLARVDSWTSTAPSSVSTILYDCNAGNIRLDESADQLGAHLAHLRVFGRVVSTAAGLIGVGWSQKNSYACDYTLRAGSFLRVKQV